MPPEFLMSPLYDMYLVGTEDMPWGLYHLQMAYAEQLCHLYYRDTSVKLVKKRLKVLRKLGYVQAFIKPTRTAGKPLYYTMGPNGMAYVAELGLDISANWRPNREEIEGYQFLDHMLDINDVLISAMLLHKADPRYLLESFRHERTLRQTPFKTVWQGTKFTVIPDSFLKFQTPDGPRMMLLEHDMGTHEQVRFRKKIRAYLAMLRQERIPIIFTTFKGERRVEQMREWTLKELTVTNEPHSIGVLFRFTSLDKPLNPATVWLSAKWQTPYDEPPQTALAA